MSILKKPYEISVWGDRWDSGQGKFVEVRLGIIGTDKMIAQCRAIEPNLVRNVNGTKKFSFKMYKQYVDTMTGEKVSNPLSDWLISERKVKLHYEDKWFDFIIKDVAENSSNYLYTYQLEDALVQELSKNGFGVTLDAQLMNNMGTAGELGVKVLEETDWTVQSEVFVQKVEEALVYISIPYSDTVKYKKVIDQTNLSFGITTEEVIFSQPTDTNATRFTALAFYSSCTEQPYRFQFIKLDNYANVSTDENRVINVANCQYYYDVFAAGKTYIKTNEGFYLPTGWLVLNQGPDAIDNKNDTTVSNWYRGARYGFAQDAEYVPLLDRYCQKFFDKTNIFNINNGTHYDSSGSQNFDDSNKPYLKFSVSNQWDGLKLVSSGIGLAKGNTYRISYKFQDITNGGAGIEQIGGHCAGFQTKEFYLYQNLGTSGAPLWKFLKSGSVYSDPIKHSFVQNTEYLVVATLLCERLTTDDSDNTNIYIQPNRGIAKSAKVQVSDIQIQKMDYAFVDNTYTSPAFVQNVISSPNGEKTSGWTAATIATTGTKTKPEIESVYGRFDETSGNFISIIDDLQGAGTSGKTYNSYLKVKFTDANQRLINSGFYDNRTLIGSVTTGEKWKLKPTLVDTPTLNYSLSEVEYNTATGCHNINTAWTNSISLSGSTEGVMIFSRGTGVSEKEFKKKKIKLVISPSGTPSAQAPVEFYIKNLELYKAVPKTEGGTDYISPGELDQSGIITTTYNFFSPAVLETVETAEELACEKVGKSELYTKYTPVFNENAEKVRSVTAKESNYFNILQSIAETFECWLSLEVGRSADGAITSKVAKFKNYAGNDNYAAFRYGVNLKDIQRTYTSKSIVTKLMVKANSNEHAQDGFCTIQRAGANPTGESYLYDFQYYHNKGLLRAEDFIHNYYINNLHSPSEDHNVDYAIQKVNEFYSISTDEDNGKAIVNSFSKKTSKTNYQVLFYAKSSIADGCHVRCDFYNSGTPLTSSQQVKLTNNKQLYILDIQSPEEIIDGTVFRIFPTDGTSTAQWPTTAQTVEISGIQIIYKDTLDGYYPRLKALNNLLLPINQSIIDLNTDLTTLRAEEAVEEGLYYAAKEGIEEVREDFKTLTNVEIDQTAASHYDFACSVPVANAENIGSDTLNTGEWAKGATFASTQSTTSKDVWTFTITLASGKTAPNNGGDFYFQPTFTISKSGTSVKTITQKVKATFAAGTNSASIQHSVVIVNDGSKARDLQNQFAQYTIQLQNSLAKLGKEPDVEGGTSAANSIKSAIATKEGELVSKEAERDKYLTYKKALNRLFFERYARFIQEGTWISEEYVDDDKYYIDAQSVLYNSCYPQVAYTINVLALSRLPGYELFEFGLGDKTYTEDPEFFEAEGGRVEVIISEKSENLDDPTKDTIRVQNFKNQFQDLFQKITATVQQTQYSTGAYQKAVALAEADVARKGEFLSDALSDANAKLSAAGQTTVEQDIDGITLTDSKTNDKMRLIGGAILMGVLDENGERKWKTGLTPEGISASLVTAGTINTGSIAIMDGNNPAFRWDAFGVSAFKADWDANGIQGTPDKTQFVRFDKHGIYGINGGVDGTSWRPTGDNYGGDPFKEIGARSTFALTWEGLKVTGQYDTVAKMGKQGNYIFYVTDTSGKGVFGVTNQGQVIATQIKTVGKTGSLPGSPAQAQTSDLVSVSDIEFGGRNLLLNTGATGKDIIVQGANAKHIGCSYSIIDGVLKLESQNITNDEIYYRFMDPEASYNTFYSLDKNKTYTFSGKVKGRVQSNSEEFIPPYVTVRHECRVGNEWKYDKATTILQNDSDVWQPFSVQIQIAAEATGFYLSFQIYHDMVDIVPFSCTYEFKDLKLEEGNIATGWASAPEDVQTEIKSLEEQLGEFDMAANSLAIYNRDLDEDSGNITWDDVILLAGKTINNGEVEDANAVYLAGWDVTSSGIIKKESGLLKTGLFGGNDYKATSIIDEVDKSIRLICGIGDSGIAFKEKCFYFDTPAEPSSGDDLNKDVVLKISENKYFRMVGADYSQHYLITANNRVFMLEVGPDYREIQPNATHYWEWLDKKEYDNLVGTEGYQYEQISWAYYVADLGEKANTILLEDGSFYTSAGRIGGWEIEGDRISKNKVNLYTGDITYPSLINSGQQSPVRLAVGEIAQRDYGTKTLTTSTGFQDSFETEYSEMYSIKVLSATKKYTLSKNVTLTQEVGGFSGIVEFKLYSPQSFSNSQVVNIRTNNGLVIATHGFSEDGSTLTIYLTSSSSQSALIQVTLEEIVQTSVSSSSGKIWISTLAYSGYSGTATITYTYDNTMPFVVLEDGSLYASAVNIKGSIEADSGRIGAFRLENQGLYSDYIQIDPYIAVFPMQTRLTLGQDDVVFEAREDTENGKKIKNAHIITNGQSNFIIQNNGGAGIKFSKEEVEQTLTNTLTITAESISPAICTTNIAYTQAMRFNYKFSKGGWLVDIVLAMNISIINQSNKVSNYLVKLRIPRYSASGQCTIDSFSCTSGNSLLDAYINSSNVSEVDKNKLWMTTNGSSSMVYVKTTINGFEAAHNGGPSAFLQFNSKTVYSATYSSVHSQNKNLYSLGHFLPNESGLALGTTNLPWETLVVNSPNIAVSDKRRKNSFQKIGANFVSFFDKIEPILYKYNNGTSNRLHAGFIAQQIEESLLDAEIDTCDFAGICIEKSGDEMSYFLRYEEFIPLNTWQIQKLKPRVSSLEQTILDYETRISSLEQKVQSLTFPQNSDIIITE